MRLLVDTLSTLFKGYILSGFLVLVVDSVKFYDYAIPIPVSPPEGVVSRDLKQQASFNSKSYRESGGGRGGGGGPAQFLVNNDKDGSYHFGYDTGDTSPKSYREEVREASGRIYGRYAYIDPDGVLRITDYVADSQGFRSTESKRFLFQNSDLQLIGPIPKPFSKLYSGTAATGRKKLNEYKSY